MPSVFWDDEYYGNPEPAPRSLRFVLLRARPRRRPRGNGAGSPPASSVVEIGCAPARWLLWYARRFGAHVRGVEYSAKGAALSRANLAAAGIPGGDRGGRFLRPGPRHGSERPGALAGLHRALRRPRARFSPPPGVLRARGPCGDRRAQLPRVHGPDAALGEPRLPGRPQPRRHGSRRCSKGSRRMPGGRSRPTATSTASSRGSSTSNGGGRRCVLLPLMPLRRMRWTDTDQPSAPQ